MAKLDGIEVKVGDRLWDFKHGWGVVEEVFYCGSTPIRVVFERNGILYRDVFSETGASCNDSTYNRTLFWDEIHVTPPPQPKKKVKKWLWVYKLSHQGKYRVTESYLSQSEANAWYFSASLGKVVYLQRIEDSMIELEE